MLRFVTGNLTLFGKQYLMARSTKWQCYGFYVETPVASSSRAILLSLPGHLLTLMPLRTPNSSSSSLFQFFTFRGTRSRLFIIVACVTKKNFTKVYFFLICESALVLTENKNRFLTIEILYVSDTCLAQV